MNIIFIAQKRERNMRVALTLACRNIEMSNT